ncbi:MAG: hypothetical protein JF595_03340 [Sphingomonadales bacterium]|nr:hypothetical protein [Sphingomonadales bacterium]
MGEAREAAFAGAALLVIIAVLPLFGHGSHASQPLLIGTAQLVTGVVAGLTLGIVASLLRLARWENTMFGTHGFRCRIQQDC